MANKPWHRGPWPKIRRAILQRDNHTCQIQDTGCTHTATHVDHIISPIHNGSWFDPSNLRAACANCNLTRPTPGRRKYPQPSRRW